MSKNLGVFESNGNQNFMITSSMILNKLVSPNDCSNQFSQTDESSSASHHEAFPVYTLSAEEIHESSRNNGPYKQKTNHHSVSYPTGLRSTDKRGMIITSHTINYSPLISIEDEIPQEMGTTNNILPPKPNIKTASITYFSHDGHSESHDFVSGPSNNDKHQVQSELSKSMFGNLDTFSILYPNRKHPRTKFSNSFGKEGFHPRGIRIRKKKYQVADQVKVNRTFSNCVGSLPLLRDDLPDGYKRFVMLSVVINPNNQIEPTSLGKNLDSKEAKSSVVSPNKSTNYEVKLIDLKLENRKHRSMVLNKIIKIVSEGKSEDHVQELISKNFDLGDVKLAKEIYQSKFRRIPAAPIEKQYQLISSGRQSSRNVNTHRYSMVNRISQYLTEMVLTSAIPQESAESFKPSIIIKKNTELKILSLMTGLIPETVIDLKDNLDSLPLLHQIINLPRSITPPLSDDENPTIDFLWDYEEVISTQNNCLFSPSENFIIPDDSYSPIPHRGTLSPAVFSPVAEDQPFIHESLITTSSEEILGAGKAAPESSQKQNIKLSHVAPVLKADITKSILQFPTLSPTVIPIIISDGPKPLPPVVKNILKPLPPIVGNILKPLPPIVGNILKPSPPIVGNILKPLPSIISNGPKLLPPIVNNGPKLLPPIVKNTSKPFPPIIGNIPKPLSPIIGNIPKPLPPIINNVPKTLSPIVVNIPKPLPLQNNNIFRESGKSLLLPPISIRTLDPTVASQIISSVGVSNPVIINPSIPKNSINKVI